MRYFSVTVILIISLMSFQISSYNFDKAWKEVETFQKDGLPQSALNKVNEIYDAAIKEKHKPFLLKSISYKSSLLQVLAEEENTDHISYLEKEYKQLVSPEKEIVGLIYYKAVQDYYFTHSYKLNERTYVEGGIPEDINLWAPKNFENKLLLIAEDILSDGEILNVDIRKYKEIISKYSPDGLKLLPTLYDLVSHTLLLWISNPINNASDFDLGFNINKEEYLSYSDNFVNVNLQTDDTRNHIFRMLSLYQKLMIFHHSNDNDEALLHIDLIRLNFVRNQSTLDNKNDLYVTALDQLLGAFERKEEQKKIWLAKATFYNNIARVDTDTEPLKKKAYGICIENEDESYYGRQLKLLGDRIAQVNLNGSGKEVYTTDEKPEFKLSATNLDKLWWKVVELPRDYRELYRNIYENNFHTYVLGQRIIQQGNVDLKQNSNFFPAETKVDIDKLPFGSYALIASSSEGIADVSKGLHFITFQISNIAYASMGNQKVDLLIADRNTGKPLKNAKVNLYNSYFDRDSRTNKRKLVTTLTSDKQGRVIYTSNAKESIVIDISYGKKDYLNVNDGYYLYEYPKQELSRIEAVMFTDRSIYRPGQKVYFKGLIINKDRNNIPSLGGADEEVTLTLRDANYQEVTTLSLRSNEFGSVSGEFMLPTGGLTGVFTIEARNIKGLNGNKQIRIEEYRRPKFKVLVNQPEGTYSLGDTLSVKGSAMAYAGVSINDAIVSYKVFRSEMRRWWWSWRAFPSEEKTLIDHGVTSTDDKGLFNLSFLAAGDNRKTWTYTIEVDILDKSGETQSGNTTIHLGMTKLSIQMEGERIRSKEKGHVIHFKIANLSGVELEEKLSITLLKLKDPGKITTSSGPEVYRNRGLSDAIDQVSSWQVDKKVRSITFSETDKKDVDISDLEEGAYKVVMTSQDVEQEDFIIINNYKKGKFPFAADLFIENIEGPFRPGEKIKVRIGTPHKELYIFLEEYRFSGSEQKGWEEVCKKKTIKTKVQEDDYGGYFIVLTYFFDNRFHSDRIRINVPWTHKDLEFEFVTMRDNLLPGQEETWSLKVKGKGKEKIAAEMLASMYDMSLDQFVKHEWDSNFYPEYSMFNQMWNGRGYRRVRGIHLFRGWNRLTGEYRVDPIQLPRFDLFIENRMRGFPQPMMSEGAVRRSEIDVDSEAQMNKEMVEEGEISSQQMEESSDSKDPQQDFNQPLRTNLDETVFFFPQLKTDDDGNIEFSFKMNEALTSWKFMMFAHDANFRTGYATEEIVTKKDLMVFPFPPRFVRQSDVIAFSAKVTNMTKDTIDVVSRIEVLNARTMQDVTGEFIKGETLISLTALPEMSNAVSWKFDVPNDFVDPILYRVYASSGDHTDGEEGMFPVLSKSILVTETKAFTVKSGQVMEFALDDLIKKSQTEKLVNLTIDYTAHPVWTAIQALPYLNDYPHDCTEQLINKFFANALGHSILKEIPNVKNVLDQWRQAGSNAFLSNLEKNQELKSAMLEETPWVMAAANEQDQKKTLALLFDINKMSNNKQVFTDKIINAQNHSGGFPWFPGGRENTYITQYVLESLAKMRTIGLLDFENDNLEGLVTDAVSFVDKELAYRYKELKRHIATHGGNMDDNHLSSIDIHYLYARSYFDNKQVPSDAVEAYNYYYGQSKEYWNTRSDLEKALIGTITFRKGDTKVTDIIVKSFSERAIHHKDLGMYWKSQGGYYWFQLPIETHTAIIGLYIETMQDTQEIEEMKLWLLNHKRTNAWSTTKSTAEAIHALLRTGSGDFNWVGEFSDPDITINEVAITPELEAGTGYFKESWIGGESSDLKEVMIKNNNNNVAWGGVYIQYFKDLDKIKQSGDQMMDIKKSLFVQVEGDHSHNLSPIDDQNVEVGDIVVNRLEIKTDRDMEFVHLKDLRASGLEPVNVLSGYRWSSGLGYYETTKDLATHFFIDYLPKGTYVFEYKLRVSHEGEFQNGLATIQCMYAPEFSSHSSSELLKVK